MFRFTKWQKPLLVLLSMGFIAADRKPASTTPIQLAWPDSGAPYRVRFVESISSPDDLGLKKSFLAKLVDIVAGPSESPRGLVRPMAIAGDSMERLLVADPGSGSVHLMDRQRKRHKALRGPGREQLRSPIGADFDAEGNIFVSDSELGKIFVFNKDGGFKGFIGDLGREGYFKRPTGLAVDKQSGEIYLTDTLRSRLYVLDRSGRILREWGTRGEGAGEFNFPTNVALSRDAVFVLDSMNFRIQVFSKEGKFLRAFGSAVNEPGGFYRPKGLCYHQSSDLLYVVDAMFDVVQAFTPGGKLVFAFGYGGTAPGQFRLPAGAAVFEDGRLLVADSYNSRVQVFHVGPNRGRDGTP